MAMINELKCLSKLNMDKVTWICPICNILLNGLKTNCPLCKTFKNAKYEIKCIGINILLFSLKSDDIINPIEALNKCIIFSDLCKSHKILEVSGPIIRKNNSTNSSLVFY